VARSPRLGKWKKLGRFVEERGREFAGAKLRVVHNIFDEGGYSFSRRECGIRGGRGPYADKLREDLRPKP